MASLPTDPRFAPFLAKMRAEKLSDSAIAAFGHSFMELASGSAGSIPESSIKGVDSLPNLVGDIKGKVTQNPALLASTVVLKLNGGLGKYIDLLQIVDHNSSVTAYETFH
jgi:UTP--glucose-1-phosphate uridylyltransferase